MPPTARHLIGRAAQVLFGVVPATYLAAFAGVLVGEVARDAIGGDVRSLLYLAWGALGVLGAAGLWLAAFRPGRRVTVALVACGVVADGLLAAAQFRANRGAWLVADQHTRRWGFVLLAPLVVGVAYLAWALHASARRGASAPAPRAVD